MKYDEIKLGDKVEIRSSINSWDWRVGTAVSKTERFEKERTLAVRTGVALKGVMRAGLERQSAAITAFQVASTKLAEIL